MSKGELCGQSRCANYAAWRLYDKRRLVGSYICDACKLSLEKTNHNLATPFEWIIEPYK